MAYQIGVDSAEGDTQPGLGAMESELTKSGRELVVQRSTSVVEGGYGEVGEIRNAERIRVGVASRMSGVDCWIRSDELGERIIGDGMVAGER